MLKTARLITAVAVATLAVPAIAGSWPDVKVSRASIGATPSAPARYSSGDGFVAESGDAVASLEQYRYFRQEETPNARVASTSVSPPPARANLVTTDVTGYRFVGGETGWELVPHKMILSGGRLAHSDECDHAIRTAVAPTPAEVDSGRTSSPGA